MLEASMDPPEEDRLFLFLELGEDPLHALFEVAAEAGAGEDRPHIQGVDLHVPEFFGDLTQGDALGKAFGDRRLSHPRLSYMNRVVFEAAAEDLDRPFKNLLPADKRIHLAGLCAGGQLRRVGPEKLVLLIFVPLDRFSLPRFRASLLFSVAPGENRGAVGDVIEEDDPGDSFPLEVKGGVGFPLFEEGYEEIPQLQSLLLSGGGVPGGSFEDALEAEGLDGPGHRGACRIGLSEVLLENLLQAYRVAAAVDDDLPPFIEKKAGVEEVFRRDEFMPPYIGLGIRRHDDPVEVFADFHDSFSPFTGAFRLPPGNISAGIPAFAPVDEPAPPGSPRCRRYRPRRFPFPSCERRA
jgi:hypothetical protein